MTLVWFRSDLRLSDNPALDAALKTEEPLVPVFIWAPSEEAPWEMGAASRAWLHRSLQALDTSLARAGSRLLLQKGPTLETLRALVRETGAKRVFWNRRYEPAVLRRDEKIKEKLRCDGIIVTTFNSHLLFEPWELQTQKGKPYQVFTPFWKTAHQRPPSGNLSTPPPNIPTPSRTPLSVTLDELALRPKSGWDASFWDAKGGGWTPGEAGAKTQLARFQKNAFRDYAKGRDCPSKGGSSRLSPHLRFGEISVWRVWKTLDRQGGSSAPVYLRELAWREFAYHLLFHFPRTTDAPMRETFIRFPWRSDAEAFNRWTKGCTGFPWVDAGLRELWATGWMHNRVRMAAASFLVKHLLVDWRMGARWFWDTLVDADLANNTLGWQWVAGCGPDAAPYYRIFNPTLQQKRFDPNGHYVRRWIPQWKTPSYPPPMVDAAAARDRALSVWQQFKRKHQRR